MVPPFHAAHPNRAAGPPDYQAANLSLVSNPIHRYIGVCAGYRTPAPQYAYIQARTAYGRRADPRCCPTVGMQALCSPRNSDNTWATRAAAAQSHPRVRGRPTEGLACFHARRRPVRCWVRNNLPTVDACWNFCTNDFTNLRPACPPF